jgi:hypothetical protein
MAMAATRGTSYKNYDLLLVFVVFDLLLFFDLLLV